MKSENVLNKNELEKYENKTFTKDGLNALENYVKTLARFYHKNNFPLKQPIILGIPMMKHSQVIKSKEMCLERIKVFSQILGIKSIKTKKETGTELIIDLDGDMNDN